MRRITEATAKVIEQALQAQIKALQPHQLKSLRVANQIRLMQLAIRELTTNKYIKNGNKSKKGKCAGSL